MKLVKNSVFLVCRKDALILVYKYDSIQVIFTEEKGSKNDRGIKP